MKKYDLLIRQAEVVDGTGAPAYRADVAVKDGRICGIGTFESAEAERLVEAEGKTLTPGFIDIHNHADLTVARFPEMESQTVQGVTTVCAGNCGMGMAPMFDYAMAGMECDEFISRFVSGEKKAAVPFLESVVLPADVYRKTYEEIYGAKIDWSGWKDYLRALEDRKTGANLMMLTAHGPIRVSVMGEDYKREATDEEIGKMCELLKTCMEEGSNGLSFGFDYAPGNYAGEEELLRLASVVAEYDGILSAHVQYSARRGLKTVPDFQPSMGYREFLEIGKKTGARLQISHLRTAWKPITDFESMNRASKAVMDLVDEYRAQGVRVNWDVLPNYSEAGLYLPMLASRIPPFVYECGSLTAFAEKLKDPVYFEECAKRMMDQENREFAWVPDMPGWENMYSVTRCAAAETRGRTLKELADQKKTDPCRAALALLREDPRTTVKFDHTRRYYIGFQYYVHHPDLSLGMDVETYNYDCNMEKRPDLPPRYAAGYADFAGMIGMILRNRDIPKERMVRAMTGRNADNLGLKDRGYLKAGMWADMVLLDWEHLEDNIDFIDPARAPKGVEAVWVNGVLTAKEGKPVHSGSGKVIRNEDREHAAG